MLLGIVVALASLIFVPALVRSSKTAWPVAALFGLSALALIVPAVVNAVTNASGEVRVLVSPHDIERISGPVSWRLLECGLLEGDKMTLGRMTLSDMGVKYADTRYYDVGNPTPAMLAGWLLLLGLISALVRPRAPEDTASKSGKAAARNESCAP